MMPEHRDRQPVLHLMLGGDVMLGRGVKEHMLRSGPGYPLDPIAGLLRHADLAIVNLECAITSSARIWPGAPKAFYFGAPPLAVQSLADAGIDLVSLANNHTLDFGVEGLLDTVRHLRSHGIRHAGAGASLDEAALPATMDRGGIRFGMAAFCDHQADFAAQQHQPGIAYLDLEDDEAATAVLRKALEALQGAGVEWPILSLHWGPNMVFRPSAKFRRLAHAAVDMGWKILFGHSAHVFQGIEIYRGCPIIYAAGDLVDDYYVDPKFRNNHQLLFELELGPDFLRRITLHPLFIEHCRTRLASAEQTRYIVRCMTSLCGELGTPVHQDGNRIWIAASDPGARPA
jgi:poly-gamma-glutamate capsule biosynthesis protein CapA/YwtB (metallophosphatase superfamily)